jgi:16S rRNA (uracil1498-N3)-methyltransferase
VILFYSEVLDDGHIFLTGEEHTHCAKALRRTSGDHVFITDGKGTIFECEIIQTSRAQTIAKVIGSQTRPPMPVRYAVGLSALKNPSRTEWFVEKAVEIGISDFYFFQSARTEGKGFNHSRLQKIIVSAGKQSMNVVFPALYMYSSFEELLMATNHVFDNNCIAHCNGAESHLSEHLKTQASTLLLIGPEGDFTDQEVSLALKYGFREVNLGSSRLRSETAALVGLMTMHLSRI